MNNFGVRLYQSGKTRRRNANKKRQFERYRQFVAEERKLESNEITFSKDKKVSKTDETQLVELINDVKVTDNAMTAEQIILHRFLICYAWHLLMIWKKIMGKNSELTSILPKTWMRDSKLLQISLNLLSQNAPRLYCPQY